MGLTSSLSPAGLGAESSTTGVGRERVRSRDQPPILIANLGVTPSTLAFVFCKGLPSNTEDLTPRHLMLTSSCQLIQFNSLSANSRNSSRKPWHQSQEGNPAANNVPKKAIFCSSPPGESTPDSQIPPVYRILTKKRRPQRPVDAIIMYNQSEVFV